MNTSTPDISNASTSAKELTSEAREGISAKLHDAGAKLVDIKDGAQKTLGNSIDAIGGVLKTHPFAAVGLGIAFGIGVGFTVSRIFFRD